MGLKFPTSIEGWQRWQANRHPARKLRGLLRSSPVGTQLVAAIRGNAPAHLLVVLESTSASSLYSLVEPLRHLLDLPLAVVAPVDVRSHLPGGGWAAHQMPALDLAHDFPDVSLLLAAGHYLPLGAEAFRQSLSRGLGFAVVQHGLMTPLAPPLPSGAHLLAWNQPDADFWRSGRNDVTTSVVGSQLLHQAASESTEHVSRFTKPTYLGQLHGAELPRAGMTWAATEFCLRTGATYRPHPSEKDRISRLTHAAWERAGIAIDRSARPLHQTHNPVVSAFSTGVLEAAARGVPAWVHYPNPPIWLREFWDRYSMRRWGDSPTPVPVLPTIEPARAIADWVKGNL